MPNPLDSSPDSQRSPADARTGADRREAVRRPVRGLAMVMLPGLPGRMGRTIDVSETGLCISLTEALASGTECMVGFELPDRAGNRRRLQSRAKVVHSVLAGNHEGFKIGMRLHDPPDEVVLALQTFVRE